MALGNDDLDRSIERLKDAARQRWVLVVDETSPHHGRRGLMTLRWSEGRNGAILVAFGDPPQPVELREHQVKDIEPGEYIVGEVMEG